jgi:Peptidase A4 family
VRLLSKLRAGCPVLALTAVLIPAAGSTVTAGAATLPGAQPGPRAVATARSSLERLLAGMSPDGGNPGCQDGATSVDSANWAGYAVCSPASGTVSDCPPDFCYTGASGSDLVPAVVRCEDCIEVFWLGLDGFSSGTIEQLGVLVEQSGGSTSYYTWWDMYPAAPHIVGTTVRAGDSISASVQRDGTGYTLSLTDATNPANSFTTTQSCPSCVNSSAEWITEAQPGTPLGDFGTWRVTGATAAAGSGPAGITAFPYAKVTMVDQSGATMVQPGPLGSDGTSFTSTWITGT